MPIEGGPRGGDRQDTPRPTWEKIEGKVATSFSEISIDDAMHIPLPAHITWQTARLTFQQVGHYTMPERFAMSSRIPLYTGQLHVLTPDGVKMDDVSLLTSKEKPVFFTGTTNGFYAHDPLIKGDNSPFYVVGINPNELQENMSRISAVWHEFGHVFVFYFDGDTKLFRAAITLKGNELPEVRMALQYGTELAQAIPDWLREQQTQFDRQALGRFEARNPRARQAVSLFHERNAWAIGANVVRNNSYPTGFQEQSSYFDYARLCLSSYAIHHRDMKFVKGWKD